MRTIKAWAAVNPVSYAILRNLEGEYAICTRRARAEYQASSWGKVIPCTITLSVPKKKAKRKA